MTARDTYTLSEIANVVDCEHKTAPTVDDSEYYSIRTTDISNGRIDFQGANRVTYETYQEWTRRAVPKPGDLILAREAPVGEVGYIKSGYRVCLGQRTVLVQVRSKLVSKRYLLYYLTNPEIKYDLQARSTGSVVAHLNLKDIRALEVVVPSLAQQVAIAAVLGSLDDKIDLLHRQNKTLEGIAQALFRRWFVDEAAGDWEEGTLGDVLTVRGGSTPSTSNPDFWDGEIHWTTPRDLSNNDSIYLFDTARRITEQGLAKISSGLMPVGTLLLSSRAPIGYLAFTEIPTAINQGYIAILDDMGLSKHFIYLWLRENMDYVKSYANGSIFLEISKAAFRSLEITIPPSELLRELENVVAPMFDGIRTNVRQIRTLEKLRDTLLPRLMSGEVRVRQNSSARIDKSSRFVNS